MSAVLETMSTILDSKKIHETLEAKGFTAEQADGIYEVVSQCIPSQIQAIAYAEQRHNDDNFDCLNQQIELVIEDQRLIREDQKMMREILIRMDNRMDRFEDHFDKIDARFEKINATLMSSRYLLVGSLCSSIIAAAGIIAVALLR